MKPNPNAQWADQYAPPESKVVYFSLKANLLDSSAVQPEGYDMDGEGEEFVW